MGKGDSRDCNEGTQSEGSETQYDILISSSPGNLTPPPPQQVRVEIQFAVFSTAFGAQSTSVFIHHIGHANGIMGLLF